MKQFLKNIIVNHTSLELSLLRKLLNTLKLIAFLPYFPVLFIMVILRPLLIIRIGRLWNDRIGHFSANTELYLCEQDAKINTPKGNYIDLFFVRGRICNSYLLKMWKREIIVMPTAILYPVYFLIQNLNIFKRNIVPEPKGLDRDIFNLFDKYDCHLRFTEIEENYGKKELNRLGIRTPFVCLNVRDSAYFPDKSSEYHSYRDCDINNYTLAVRKLNELGYFVVRMGAKVNQALNINSTNFIDYATIKGFRSEFLDIYLAEKCFFSISTSTGWDSLPYMFKKPIVYAPIIPFGTFFTFSRKAIGIPKKYKINNKNLNIKDIFNSGYAYFLTSEEYRNNDIILEEPTQQEIWDVVEEMIELIKTDFALDLSSKQKDFFTLLKSNPTPLKKYDFHGICYQGRIGSRYLESNF